jgi:hypothetical protein
MTGVISLILISLILLIKDMDDPFEVGKKTFAHRPQSYVQTRRATQEPVMNTLNHHDLWI